jgi:hypothetical protein
VEQEDGMSSDNQFTALGPTEIGFQTNGTNIRMGASIAGNEIGVAGNFGTGFGIEGSGGGGGVHGIGTLPPNVKEFGIKTGVGVLGESRDDNGVRGVSNGNDGAVGMTSTLNRSGVFGLNATKPSSTEGGGEIPTSDNQVGFGVFGRCGCRK